MCMLLWCLITELCLGRLSVIIYTFKSGVHFKQSFCHEL
jgi:hypothetical protein